MTTSTLRLLLALGLLCLNISNTLASNWSTRSDSVIIYQLTKEEVKTIQTNKSDVDLVLLNKPVMCKLPNNYDMVNTLNTMPVYGNFALLSLSKNKVKVTLHSKLDFNAYVIEYRDKPALVIKNSREQSVGNLAVYTSNETFRIDSTCMCYPMKKSDSNTPFFIESDRGILELYITEHSRNNHYNNDYYYGFWYRLKQLFIPRNNSNYHSTVDNEGFGRLPGFIITDKPKYRKGEKIELKAFIFNGLNKPYLSNVYIEFKQNNKLLLSKEIESVSPGAFVTDFVVGDSLLLDSYVKIEIKDKILKKVLRSTQVKIADYKLPDSNITIDSPNANSKINKNNTAKIAISAYDFNKFPLLGAKVDVVVKFEYFRYYWQRKNVVIPDTLFHLSKELSKTGVELIELPDSIFKNVDMNVKCIVTVNSAQFERKTQQFSFDYNTELEKLELQISNKTLHVFSNDSSIKTATLYFNSNLIHDVKTVSIPYTENLTDAYATIQATSGKYSARIQNFTYSNKVGFNVKFKPHKAIISLENPTNTEVLVELFQSNLYIKTHHGKQFFYEGYIDEHAPIYVYYSYILNGQWHQDVRTIQYRDKQLEVTAYFPETSFPGQDIDATIVVRDMNTNLKPEVNLTAYATNNQFGNVSMPSLPYLGETSTPARFDMDYALKTMHFTEHTFDISKVIYTHFENENNLYYELLFYNGKLFQYAEPADNRSFTHLKIEVYDSLKPVRPSLIYVDDKLVWSKFGETGNQSVIVTPGKHTLSVRMANKLIKNQVIDVKPNAINHASIKLEACLVDNKEVFEIAPTLTPNERELIQQTHFVQRGLNTIVAYSQNSFFQKSNYSSYTIVGPINKAEPLRILYANSFPKEVYIDSLLNQPKITQQYLHFKPFVGFDTLLHDYSSNYYSNQNFLEETDLKLEYVYFEVPELITEANPLVSSKGNAELVLMPKGNSYAIRLLSLKSLAEDSIKLVFKNFHQYFYDLKPGKYELLMADGEFMQKDTITLHPDKRTYYAINLYMNNNGKEYSTVKNETIINSLKDEKGGKIIGVVEDNITLEPLPFVNVVLTQDNKQLAGTSTDFDGKFVFEKIPEGQYAMKLSFTGYLSQQIVDIKVVKANNTYLVARLKPTIVDIEEFTIIEFTVPLIDKDNTVQGGTITRDDIKNMAARDAASVADNVGGVYSVNYNDDDLVIRGSREDDNFFFIDGIKVRGANNLPKASLEQTTVVTGGVPSQFGNTSGGLDEIENAPFKIGKNALKAKAIRNNFSDVGFWVPNLVTNERGRANFTATLPDNITSWNAKILAVGYDGSCGTFSQNIYAFKPLFTKVYGPRFAIAGDSITHYATAINYTGVNQKIQVCGDYDATNVLYDTYTLTSDLQEELGFRIAPDATKVNFEFNLKLEPDLQYSDGEQIELPVYPKGIMVDSGMFVFTSSDTTFTYQTAIDGPVQVNIMPSLSNLMEEEIRYLSDYSHLCNEQASSKLLGILAQQVILENKGQQFGHQEDVNLLIKRLMEGKNEFGIWGWWRGTSTVDWITMQVLKALEFAQQLNYKVDGYAPAVEALQKLYGSFSSQEKLMVLPSIIQSNPKADSEKYVKELKKADMKSTFEKLQYEYIKALIGQHVAVDSIKSWATNSFDSLPVWQMSKMNFQDPFKPTFLALQIFNHIKSDVSYRDRILFSLLKMRNNNHWLNTKQSADMLLEISKMKKDVFTPANQSVTINGKTYTIGKEQHSIATHGKKTVIQVNTNQLIFISVSQRKWQTETSKTVSSNFEIATSFLQSKVKYNSLKVGEPATLRAKVTSTSQQEFVMVEIPIPAGCEVEQDKCYKGYNETYREYARDKVSIYYQVLRPGQLTIEIPLQVRFKGEYTLNPAYIEAMYTPTFNAYESTRIITIK